MKPPLNASITEWENYCQNVTPLSERHKNRVAPITPPRNTRAFSPSKSQSTTQQTFNWDHNPQGEHHATRWSRYPVSRQQWKKWLSQRPEHCIDLHGHSLDQAFHAVSECLHQAILNNERVILCIHGQGFGSYTGESVLRQSLRQWLPHCTEVSAFSAAPDHRGGDGATLIWLRAEKHRR